VKDHFGKSTDDVIAEISKILRHGMLKQKSAAAPVAKRAAKVVKRARA
jgi:hypothetical protein